MAGIIKLEPQQYIARGLDFGRAHERRAILGICLARVSLLSSSGMRAQDEDGLPIDRDPFEIHLFRGPPRCIQNDRPCPAARKSPSGAKTWTTLPSPVISSATTSARLPQKEMALALLPSRIPRR